MYLENIDEFIVKSEYKTLLPGQNNFNKDITGTKILKKKKIQK